MKKKAEHSSWIRYERRTKNKIVYEQGVTGEEGKL